MCSRSASASVTAAAVGAEAASVDVTEARARGYARIARFCTLFWKIFARLSVLRCRLSIRRVPTRERGSPGPETQFCAEKLRGTPGAVCFPRRGNL